MSDEQASVQSVRVDLYELMPSFNFISPVTPEKLCSPEFMKLLGPLCLRGELNRLVVDEVGLTHSPASVHLINFIRHTVYLYVFGLCGSAH